jgi:hypothetical protein
MIAVTAILVARFGATLLSFPTAPGIAAGIKRPTGDVSQARGTADLPIQKIHDMSVVFSWDD